MLRQHCYFLLRNVHSVFVVLRLLCYNIILCIVHCIYHCNVLYITSSSYISELSCTINTYIIRLPCYYGHYGRSISAHSTTWFTLPPPDIWELSGMTMEMKILVVSMMMIVVKIWCILNLDHLFFVKTCGRGQACYSPPQLSPQYIFIEYRAIKQNHAMHCICILGEGTLCTRHGIRG